MKKTLVLLLAALMLGTSMFSCGQTDNDNDNDVTTEQETVENQDSEEIPEHTQFTLSYPESMTAQGFEPLVLESEPTRIVCTATSSVTTLHKMGASIIAMPSSVATADIAEENPDITLIKSLMSDDFNIEDIVALNPDLVIISTSYKDSYGETLENLGINVYYQAAGHGVAYETVKSEALCLIDAFSVDDESTAKGNALKESFEDIEKRCAELSETYSDKSVMVLQAGGVGYVYGQTSNGTLGSMMRMLGFNNVADTTAAASMFEIDYETALVGQPDLLVVVGAGDADATKAVMDEIIAANPDYWNAMTAVTDEQILCLGVEYIATYGIQYVDELAALTDIVADFYAE